MPYTKGTDVWTRKNNVQKVPLSGTDVYAKPWQWKRSTLQWTEHRADRKGFLLLWISSFAVTREMRNQDFEY